MEWRLSGQPQSVILEFLADGQPVVPDADSIKFFAWDNSGTLIQSYPFTQPDGAIPTQMEVVMSLELSDIPSNVLFETRYVRAEYMVNSKPYSVEKKYRLHHMIPMTADAQSVRALVGADHDELPDSDVSVIEAYIALASAYGTAFDDALRRTDVIALTANRAISLKAAVLLLPSFQARLVKLEKSDNAGFQRADMNFGNLAMELEAELAEAMEQITTAISGTPAVVDPPTFFLLTSQTDRITNSES